MTYQADSLNILYVGTLPPHQGGSAISGSQLLIGFAKSGHQVTALAPMTREALEAGDSFSTTYAEIDVRRFLLPYFETAPDTPPPDHYRKLEGEQIQKLFRKVVEPSRPDIVLIGRETFAWHVPELAREYALPCVLIVAGCTTHGILNKTLPEEQAQGLLANYRKANLVVAPARHLADSLRKLDIKRIKVIPNAIDLQQFFPQTKDEALLESLGLGKEDLIVVHASNMKSIKRPQDIVTAAAQVLPQHSKIRYLIIGDGPCKQAMENACRERNLDSKFRFVGWIDYDQMVTYLNLADMVVMPSDGEGLALVYLETQACGRVLLASDIPAAREVIEHGKSGLLFRRADVGDMAARILEAAESSAFRLTIGHNARERVQAHSIEKAVAQYVSTFKELIQAHRKE